VDEQTENRVSFQPGVRNVRCDLRVHGLAADDVAVPSAAEVAVAFQVEPMDVVRLALRARRHDFDIQVPRDAVVQGLVPGSWAAAADKAAAADPAAAVSAIDVPGGAVPARFVALFCAARVAARPASAAIPAERQDQFALEVE